MLEVNITNDMLTMAKAKSHDMGKLYNSITRGEGNLAGFIGEAMVASVIGAAMANTYDYDLVAGALTIDVKTKRTGKAPQPHYECSVADFNTKQACDWYLFTRVHTTLTKGWILGYLPKREFYKKAKFCRKGEVDLTNYFIFKADCYNIKIEELWTLSRRLLPSTNIVCK